jgi:hypothetical protein
MAISLGPVKDYVQGYATALASMFGIKTAGGWRASDPFPDHPSGHAVDFMITDIGTGGRADKNTQGKAAGDALANYAVANADALGVKYVIWNHNVWTRAKGWHPYAQAGQGPHDDHVHITWNDAPGSVAPSGISALPGSNAANLVQTGLLSGASSTVDRLMKQAEGTATTLAVAGLGLALVAAGLWLTVSPKVQQAVNSLPSIKL